MTIGEAERTKIEEAKQAVNKAFQSVNINGNIELRLAVLAKISQELLGDLENETDEKLNKATA